VGTATNGFQTIMNLYEVLKAVPNPATMTSADIVTALQGGSFHQFLLGPNFTCNGKAFPGLNAVCSLATSVNKYDGTNVKFVAAEDPSTLVSGG